MKIRVQKLIATAGYCSRRAAEELIAAGRVTVNGKAAQTGDSAEPGDVIEIDGKPIAPPGDKVYIMLNKPRGYVTTMSDEKGRRNVSELVSDLGARVYPVGRLDMNSEGLLLMTDDGDLAHKLMHPSHGVEKTYSVRVRGENIPAALETLRSPMEIDGKPISPARVVKKSVQGDSVLLHISISEGRNRQIRKMCAFSGLSVLSLKRISEGPLRLGELPAGKWRYLSQDEIDNLQNM